MLEIPRHTTSVLKGIAITFVVLHHFVRRFEPEFFHFLGNHFVSIFFVVSGIGISYSLTKLSYINSGLRRAASYFKTRCRRIYPMYWLMLLLVLLKDGWVLPLEDFLLQFLLLDFNNPPRVWFLFAIVQCYLVAPLLFQLLRKSVVAYVAIVILCFAACNWLLPEFGVPNVRVYSYKSLYMSHVFLFALGLVMPIALSNIRVRVASITSVSVFLVFCFVCYITSEYVTVMPAMKQPLNVLFLLSSLACCASFVLTPALTRKFRFLALLGNYSFSIYLFHGMVFFVLASLGLQEESTALFYIAAIVLTVTGLIGCMVIEEFVNSGWSVKSALDRVKSSWLHLYG
jgi:peptidoglycan/LPS O-acetylase OafA/YrhL